MKILFPSLETRFNANATLVKVGRKLFRGLRGEPVRESIPFTEVTGELTDTPN